MIESNIVCANNETLAEMLARYRIMLDKCTPDQVNTIGYLKQTLCQIYAEMRRRSGTRFAHNRLA